MERILDAAESLMAGETFESTSVADIVRLAGTSVGAFYARFPTKDDLLPALYMRRYGGEHRRRSLEYLEQLAARSLPLEELAIEVVRNMVAYYDFNAPLLRQMDRCATCAPAGRNAVERQHQAGFHAGWTAAFLGSPEMASGPEAERSVRFALFLVSAACREAIVYPERGPADTDEDELEAALRGSLVRSLRAAPA